MLEGTEFEQKIGQVGAVIVDVTPELKVKIAASVEIDLLAEVKKLAAKTPSDWDDKGIVWIENLIKAGNALA